MYRNRKYIPKIKLIVKAPSKDRKPFEKVENEWIHEYATKYGDVKLLNIKSNPNLKSKEVKFKVSMENETQLRERLTKLGITLKIKDDPVNKFFYYGRKVDGERYRSVAAFRQSLKVEAMTNYPKTSKN